MPLDASPFATGLRWLYVDFNSYFASVEQQLRPELRGKPVAVVPVETDSTCAIAASYEAKAFGVKTGTPIYEARKKCPELVCVLANHERYVDYHHRICAEVEKHIPITAVCSIDEVAARLMDNETSVVRVTEIAHAIKRGLAQHVGEHIRCSIGVAANRYLAKVATDMQKPNGLTILLPDEVFARLEALPLRDLPGIGFRMEQRLLRQGIGDIKTLLALDVKQMRRVWGNIWGERLWYYLRGVELPEEEAPERKTIGHSHVLAPHLRPADKAKLVARRLLLKAASRLRRLDHHAAAVSLALRLESGHRLEATAKLYRAQDSFTFLQTLEELWKVLQTQSKDARIKKISILLHGLVPTGALVQELFPPMPAAMLAKRQKSESISRALDRLNHRYGRDTVAIGMLPSDGRSFSGSKVAFTRIPDKEEFLE